MSKVIIVDKNDEVIGYKLRNNRTSEDIIRIAGIWMENEKNEVLIAQRSKNKKNDPGKWGPAAAGTLEKGETYKSNILKEVEEEIGIILESKDLIYLGAFYEQASNQYFVGTFYAKITSDSKFTLQQEEVEAVRWISWSDLETEVKKYPEKYLLSLDRGILKRIKKWKSQN